MANTFRTGSQLTNLAPSNPTFFYDADLAHQFEAGDVGTVIQFTGGTNVIPTFCYIDTVYPAYIDGKTVIQVTPLQGMGYPTDGVTGTTDGTWSIEEGITDGGGVEGSNLVQYRGDVKCFHDPDSPIDLVAALGAEITVASSSDGQAMPQTIFVARTFPDWPGGTGYAQMVQTEPVAGSTSPTALLRGGVWSITRPAPDVPVNDPVVAFVGAVKLLLIGDSVTLTNDLFVGILTEALPNAASIVVDNMGVGSSRADTWQPGSANYIAAVAAANATGSTVCQIALGINDVNVGQSPAYIIAGIQAIIDGLWADVPTLETVMVQDIPSPIGATTQTFVDALSAADFGAGAVLGTMGVYAIFEAYPYLLYDPLHPNFAGKTYLSREWLTGLLPVITGEPTQAPDNLQWNQSIATETLTQYDHWLDPETGSPTKTVTVINSGESYPIQPVNGRAYRAVAVANGVKAIGYFTGKGL